MALALILGVIVMSAVLLAVRRPLCALLALARPALFVALSGRHPLAYIHRALAIVPPLFGNGALALSRPLPLLP